MSKRTLRKKKRGGAKRHSNNILTVHKKLYTKSKQRGGDTQIGGNLKPVLLGILDERYVLLPSTRCINDKDLINTFLSSVTAFDLLKIIGDNDKFVNSNSISGLIDDIDEKSSDFSLINTISFM